jgi:protein SCO1/2
VRATALFLVICAVCLAAEEDLKLPPVLEGIGIDQKLNSQVPMDTAFRDETGGAVTLGSLMQGKPAVLALVYYTCPMLCSQILQGVVSGLKPLSLAPGRDFNVIAISIDPRDTPAAAAEKRQEYARRYSFRHMSTDGWHFLTGTQEAIHAVTEAVGFRYRWDERSQMFIHASGVMILTPEGRAARYFYGVEYEPKDLKLGLIEASNRKIGSVVDRVLLFCYHYDPSQGKYSTAVLNLLRAAAALMACGLAIALAILWRRDLRAGHVTVQKAELPKQEPL